VKYVLDIEANGLLETATEIHCVVLMDLDTKAVLSFRDINEAVSILKQATLIVGHNVLCFDLPLIEKLTGNTFVCEVHDTLLLSRMRWPDIETLDYGKHYHIPKDLVGHYSLKAFGYRVGLNKDEYTGGWDKWSAEMQAYCEQDVRVTYKLYKALEDSFETHIPKLARDIETEFQKVIHTQEQLGVPFDLEKAKDLYWPLAGKKFDLTVALRKLVPPKATALKTKVKYEEFNPGSRDQIAQFFINKYRWQPTKLTPSGKPKLGEEELDELEFPEAKMISEYFKIQKLMGMMSDGDNSWFQYVKNGRIHGRVITIGAVTGRCTHSSPNLAQIPSSSSFMGKEVRELFYAPEGYKLVGVDAKGLELRCLGHYLYNYDNGIYAGTVVTGDIHTYNQRAFDVKTRDESKRAIYAMLYGAGAAKLGSIVAPEATEDIRKSRGYKMKANFLQNVPAMERLLSDLNFDFEHKGHIIGIDKRVLKVRHKHAILNTLLQNAGSTVVKLATVIFHKEMKKLGIEAYPALHVHDEFQTICREEDAEEVGKQGAMAIKIAGQLLGFRCELDGDYKIGQNWAETH
jgi:DNA polymerase-1